MSSAHARAYDTRHIMCCRYRAIATAPSLRSHPQSLQRSSTFQAESTPFYHRGAPSEAARPRSKTRCLFSKSSLSQLSNHNKSGDEASEEDFVESADLPLLPQKFGSLQGMSLTVAARRHVLTAEVAMWRFVSTEARAVSPADSSSDSFHSTLDEMPPDLLLPLPGCHQLYHTGLHHAMEGQVPARTLR